MRLHFRAYGRGPPLLMLHGLFGSLDNWHSISLKLSSSLHVLAVDQRNHGQSPHAPEMSYSLMAQDLEELVRTVHLPRVHVLGHSMGGKTAMQFALLYPERIDKLVIVDIAPRTYPPHHEQIIAALLTLDLTSAKDRRHFEQLLAPAIPDLSTRQFLLKNLKRNPDGGSRWQLGLREIQQAYPRLSEEVTGKAFGDPVLFLRGEHSNFLKEEDLPEIRRLFPQARMETVARAGHLPHAENPAEFLERLTRFLSPQFYRNQYP